ncbi:hypothetical protein C0991_011290 [Blastosporella zonata]|nr:hypothetical protein C0991_011290 [Blastosporella zonata]
MHNCLQIPEILDAIFVNLVDVHSHDDTDIPFPGSTTLVNIALTCRAFKESALDVLWNTISGLDPIVGCLPHDAVCTIEEARDIPARDIPVAWRSAAKRLRFNRNIVAKDYTRIRENASRIRTVCRPQSGYSQSHTLDKLFLHVLYSRQQVVGPILPHVQHAMFSADDFKDHAVYPRLIIGPRLTSIEIAAFENSNSVADGFEPISSIPWKTIGRVLAEALSPIQVFKLDEYRTMDQWKLNTFVSEDATSLLSGFQSLKVLEALSLEVDHFTFLRFSTLPCLEELTISISSVSITHVVRHHTHCDQLFPALTKLYLSTSSLKPCAELIELPHAFERLTSLEIRSGADDTSSLHHFFQSIQRNALLSRNLSFLKFKADCYPWTPPSDTHGPIDLDTIAPLLSLPNLSSLHLDAHSPVHLTNDDLPQMGKAWPRLEVLNLPDRTTYPPPRMTLVGLLPLLASCPSLRQMTLCVDATQDVPSFAELGPIVPHRSLAEFCYCRSPIRDSSDVAAFLALALAGLERMGDNWLYDWEGVLRRGYYPPEEAVDLKYRALWREVEEKLYQVLLHSDS